MVPAVPTMMTAPVPIPWTVVIRSVVIVSPTVVAVVVITWIIVSWSVGEPEADTRLCRLRTESRQTKSCESNKQIFFHSIVPLYILWERSPLFSKLDDRSRSLLQMIARNHETGRADRSAVREVVFYCLVRIKVYNLLGKRMLGMRIAAQRRPICTPLLFAPAAFFTEPNSSC